MKFSNSGQRVGYLSASDEGVQLPCAGTIKMEEGTRLPEIRLLHSHDSFPIPLFMWTQLYDPKTCSRPPLPTRCIEEKQFLERSFGRGTQTTHCTAYVRIYTGLVKM